MTEVRDIGEAKSTTTFIKSPLITIIVNGGESTEESFQIHQDLLIARSDYFKNALNAHWAESNDRTLRMPDVDSEAMAVYLEFLYTDKLPVSQRTEDGVPDFPWLAKVYVLAEQLMDSTAKNAVMHGFFSQMRTPDTNGAFWFPADIVQTVYDGTASPTNPARRLLVDLYHDYGTEVWLKDPEDELPRDFLLELSQVMIKSSKRNAPLPIPASNVQQYLENASEGQENTGSESGAKEK